MHTITKRFDFSASHILEGLPPEHPCSRLHGHNYSVTLALRSIIVDEVGMVLDYRALAPFKALLDERYDHRHLNDVVPFNPTAEMLAKRLYHDAKELFGDRVAWVEVRETEKTCARWEP